MSKGKVIMENKICPNCGVTWGLTTDEQIKYDKLIRICEVRRHTDEEFKRFEYLNKKKYR